MKAVNLIPGEQRPGAGRLAGRSGGARADRARRGRGLAALAFMYGSASHAISSQTGEVGRARSAGRRGAAHAPDG